MPFSEESCRSSCIYSGPLHSHSRDAVSQHPSTRAGAESIQLIYSGRAFQALSDLARQFRCHPIFWREFPFFNAGGSVCVRVCMYTHTHTHTAQMGYLDVSPGVGMKHLESRKNPDRLKRSTHVDCIGVQSTFVYMYSGLRVLMI